MLRRLASSVCFFAGVVGSVATSPAAAPSNTLAHADDHVSVELTPESPAVDLAVDLRYLAEDRAGVLHVEVEAPVAAALSVVVLGEGGEEVASSGVFAAPAGIALGVPLPVCATTCARPLTVRLVRHDTGGAGMQVFVSLDGRLQGTPNRPPVFRTLNFVESGS